MLNLTPTQTKALELLNVEFKSEENVYATWVNGTPISQATMRALCKKGCLEHIRTDKIPYEVRGNFGRDHYSIRYELVTYYKRVN